ncbi:MAG: response regulator, partial [Thermoanaerobaculia bacterium]
RAPLCAADCMERRRSPMPPARPLVLIVDGHDDTRDMYASALTVLDFETMTDCGDAQVFERAWATRPDVIVTELTLPGTDGWSFVRDLKRDARTRDIPVVVVTACGQACVREQAETEGCAAFFVKPCLAEDLATELRHVLERHAHAQVAASR